MIDVPPDFLNYVLGLVSGFAISGLYHLHRELDDLERLMELYTRSVVFMHGVDAALAWGRENGEVDLAHRIATEMRDADQKAGAMRAEAEMEAREQTWLYRLKQRLPW